MPQIDSRDLIVTYGTNPQRGFILVVRGSNPKQVVFQSDSKSAVIAKAQQLKGWEQADGDERTYAQQTIDHSGEAR